MQWGCPCSFFLSLSLSLSPSHTAGAGVCVQQCICYTTVCIFNGVLQCPSWCFTCKFRASSFSHRCILTGALRNNILPGVLFIMLFLLCVLLLCRTWMCDSKPGWFCSQGILIANPLVKSPQSGTLFFTLFIKYVCFSWSLQELVCFSIQLLVVFFLMSDHIWPTIGLLSQRHSSPSLVTGTGMLDCCALVPHVASLTSLAFIMKYVHGLMDTHDKEEEECWAILPQVTYYS